MKKSELNRLITRKRTLSESLDIINEVRRQISEVGGFDDPETMYEYHGNYSDELVKTFMHFDMLSNDLIEASSKIMDNQERKRAGVILNKFADFMEAYSTYLLELKDKMKKMSRNVSRTNLPNMGNIGLNESND